jgi:hypothetical protein
LVGSTAVATMLHSPVARLAAECPLAAVVIVYWSTDQPVEFLAIRKVRTMEFRWASPRSAC